ncbi:MAG TPA: hypothetical protein VK016_03800 [Arenimonas sp.]|nr:hypothetical protein [Arenimonas sp.]
MRRILLPFALAAALAAGSAQAQSFSSLEERMTASEFKAAGLDKLSEEELAALNAWLAGEMGKRRLPAATPMADDRIGFAGSSLFGGGSDGEIRSHIEGEFRGWSGKGEKITLANGQVWETVDSAARLRIKVENPQVVISQGALGAWYLRVEGYNARVNVKRIK